ncbi:MAG: FixH family protein [Gammaproteobacteria bacterium]|nr:FixH family protein [Gammaproteobacteria bacterium]
MGAGRQRPWHHEPMVWLVVAIPATAVVVGVALLVLSIKHYDGLVADDYYRQGLGINRSLELRQQAAELGLSGEVGFDYDSRRVTITLRGSDSLRMPPSISMNLRHSTRSGWDRRNQLAHTGEGVFTGELPELVEGKWYVQLESTEWKMTGVLTLPLAEKGARIRAGTD